MTLCAVPDAIYQAYRRVLPKRKNVPQTDVNIDEDEIADALADAENYSYEDEKGGEA